MKKDKTCNTAANKDSCHIAWAVQPWRDSHSRFWQMA